MEFWVYWLGMSISIIGLILLIDYWWANRYRYPDARRIQVHEAGHAVVAWACTLVADISRIDTLHNKEGVTGGLTAFNLYKAKNVPTLWCDLVIALAGIAAEANIYRSFRSSWSQSDLSGSHKISRQLAELGELEPPWENSETHSLPFQRMYQSLMPAQLIVLNRAYAMSRHLLIKHDDKFRQLMLCLEEHSIITTPQINKVMGTKSFMRFLPPSTLFV